MIDITVKFQYIVNKACDSDFGSCVVIGTWEREVNGKKLEHSVIVKGREGYSSRSQMCADVMTAIYNIEEEVK